MERQKAITTIIEALIHCADGSPPPPKEDVIATLNAFNDLFVKDQHVEWIGTPGSRKK